MQTRPVGFPADGLPLAVPPPQSIPGIACRAGLRRTHRQELPAHGRPPVRGGGDSGPRAQHTRCERHERTRRRVPEDGHVVHGARTRHGDASLHCLPRSCRRDRSGDANIAATRFPGTALRRTGPLAQEPPGDVRESAAGLPEGDAAHHWVVLHRHRHGGGSGRHHARSRLRLPGRLRRKGRLASSLRAQHPAVPLLERENPARPVGCHTRSARRATGRVAAPSRGQRRSEAARSRPRRLRDRSARSRDAPADGPPGSAGAGSGCDTTRRHRLGRGPDAGPRQRPAVRPCAGPRGRRRSHRHLAVQRAQGELAPPVRLRTPAVYTVYILRARPSRASQSVPPGGSRPAPQPSADPCLAARTRHGAAGPGILARGEIGDVLRHRSARSTTAYARYDHGALRPLARPWPVPGGER